MASGVTLSLLRDRLRSEIGASPNPAMGTNAHHAMNTLLERTQERLWYDFDWPNMMIDRDINLVDGQRYYAFPAQIAYDRIICTNVKYAASWRPVIPGLNLKDYNFMDSDDGIKQDPPLKWRHYEDNMLEVWPIPASASVLRLSGIRKLKPLVMDTDVCEIDDKLIVLYAASEMLSHTKSADAPAKLALANAHYARLRGLNSKNEVVRFGGGLMNNEHNHGLIGGRMPNP
jgi:hypothetical protein